MSQTYDFAVVIGRFSPCDNGHVERLSKIGEVAHRVLVLVSAADKARADRFPWTADEREAMLRAGLGAVADTFVFGRVGDHTYAPASFADEVRQQFDAFRGTDTAGKVAVVSRAADVRPAALSALPADWIRITPPSGPDPSGLLAALYAADDEGLAARVPSAVVEWLRAFRDTKIFSAMAAEHRYVEDYKRAWAVAPYPVILVTTDLMAVQPDAAGVPHILLVRRGGIPGKGLWALPGGFLNPEEELVDGALRELREETGLALPDEVLTACLVASHPFSDPERSSRGRVISHGFHFALPAGPLPVVAGADDAEHAVWLPLAELPSLYGQFFEDHGAMIEYFLAGEA